MPNDSREAEATATPVNTTRSTVHSLHDSSEENTAMQDQRSGKRQKLGDEPPSQQSPSEGNAEFQRIHKLAMSGDAVAQAWVGYFYQDGVNDVKQDLKMAVHWYQKAAEQNCADAQCNLGTCYSEGTGVEKDHKMAVYWYQKSADLNDAAAQFGLGCCYENGHGVDQDDAMAVHWYRKAAHQDDADAQNALGICYYDGRGVEQQDYERAMFWHEKAAAQDHARAYCRLGICYSNGHGVEQDHDQALAYFHQAADQNDSCAQYNLGMCHLLGNGCRQNLVIAQEWLLKAVENNLEEARQLAEQLRQILSKPPLVLKEPQNECPVCFESFGHDWAPFKNSNCQGEHIFCIKCIQSLLLNGTDPKCPQCRLGLGHFGLFEMATFSD